jgi:uncharacterized protein
MRRSTPFLTAAALVAISGCGAAASRSSSATLAVASVPATTATVTTTGTGTVSGTPDVMTAQIGVDNSAAHVAAALSANNAISVAVQAALEHQGVAVADIQTAGLSVNPRQSHGTVTGYEVTDVVTVTIHSLSKAGTVLDDALAAAGDAGRLEGVSFSMSNDNPLLAQARQQAVTAARTDAQQLANGAGLKLIGLRSITDETDQDGSYSVPEDFAGSVAAPAVPVQPGTEQTTVQISAVWSVSS